MAIQPLSVQNSTAVKRKPLNPVSLTGYASLAFGTASVVAGANKKIKAHKYLAYIAGALAFLHTGIVEGRKISFKKGVK